VSTTSSMRESEVGRTGANPVRKKGFMTGGDLLVFHSLKRNDKRKKGRSKKLNTARVSASPGTQMEQH